MHHLSVSWYITRMEFSKWNIKCFGQNELIKVQIFKLLSALIKVPPISHVIFETITPGFIQILHRCLVSWTPLYFCNSNLVVFRQKELIEKKFSDFWVVGWKFTKFLISNLKLQVSFPLNFASLFSVIRHNSSLLF